MPEQAEETCVFLRSDQQQSDRVAKSLSVPDHFHRCLDPRASEPAVSPSDDRVLFLVLRPPDLHLLGKLVVFDFEVGGPLPAIDYSAMRYEWQPRYAIDGIKLAAMDEVNAVFVEHVPGGPGRQAGRRCSPPRGLSSPPKTL